MCEGCPERAALSLSCEKAAAPSLLQSHTSREFMVALGPGTGKTYETWQPMGHILDFEMMQYKSSKRVVHCFFVFRTSFRGYQRIFVWVGVGRFWLWLCRAGIKV
jgi:hypothetical protein